MTDLEVPRSKEPFLPPSLHPAYPRPSVMGLIQAPINVFIPLLKNSTIILFVCGKLTPLVMGQLSREISQLLTVKTCECLVAKVGTTLRGDQRLLKERLKLLQTRISERANVSTHKQKYGQLAGLQIPTQMKIRANTL